MSRRKYHVGHIVPEKWVFGMFDTQSRVGVLEFVEDRTQARYFCLFFEILFLEYVVSAHSKIYPGGINYS